MAWTSNQIHRGNIKRNSTKKEKKILQKLKIWVDTQQNRNEELIYVKEKPLDELRYRNIKDAMKRNNRMFQEDQKIFYRKTQGTKQLKEKVSKMENLKSSLQESGKVTPKPLNKNR